MPSKTTLLRQHKQILSNMSTLQRQAACTQFQSVSYVSGRRCPQCFVILGSGSLPEALVPLVKAQLLAFLIYTTPALLQQQLQGAGQAPEKAQEGSGEDAVSELGQKLPGPCPVLRRLISFDPSNNAQPTVSRCCCPKCFHSSQAGVVCCSFTGCTCC